VAQTTGQDCREVCEGRFKQAVAVLTGYLNTVPQGIRKEVIEGIMALMSLCLQAIERMWPVCPACGGVLLRKERWNVVCALCNKEYSIYSE
jgi:hypothetical protein